MSIALISEIYSGSYPKPGEISLAHKGVLFLDELPEYSRQVLEVLREPLESGRVCISRAKAQIEYPANFQLVAAMNPCPCGFYGDTRNRCECSNAQIQRYRSKISGPLLDRIDLQVKVASLSINELQDKPTGESSETVGRRVIQLQSIQKDRQGILNSALSGHSLREYCALGQQERALLGKAMEKLKLSARAYDRILRVSRTIADMENSDAILNQHISEALSYRSFDRTITT